MFSFPLYVASWYRKSPYWERTVEAGCKSWDLYNHMLIPTFYDDDEQEYWHLLKHVTLWDVAVERQVEITVQEPDVSPLQVQGPKSKPLIRDLFGDDVMNLRYYRCIESDIEGIPVVVSRTGWTGEVGYEIYLRDSSRGLDLWDRVMEAGLPYEIRAIAPSEPRRIEAGIFNYGSDMTIEN